VVRSLTNYPADCVTNTNRPDMVCGYLVIRLPRGSYKADDGPYLTLATGGAAGSILGRIVTANGKIAEWVHFNPNPQGSSRLVVPIGG
jgi:hypothetical protein